MVDVLIPVPVQDERMKYDRISNQGEGPKLTFPEVEPHRDDTTLLLPESNAVFLLGRSRELAELSAWCQKETPLSVRVMVGPGGMGKTRLAMEFCRHQRTLGWKGGFLKRGDLDAFLQKPDWNHWFPDGNTLIVLDDASWSSEHLKKWLDSLTVPQTGNSRLRLLLLERHAIEEGGWFQQVFRSRLDGDWRRIALLDPANPVELAPLADDDRRPLLQAVVTVVGGRVQIPRAGEDMAFDRDLARTEWWGHPLYLLMAGLEMRDRGEARPVLRLKKPELAVARAEREKSRIQEYGSSPAEKRLLPHLAAQATLCAGLTREQMVRLARQESEALGYHAAPAELADRLHTALPAPEEGIATIRPDFLAEAFILRAMQEGETSLPRVYSLAPKPVVETLVRLIENFSPPTYPQPLSWFQALVDGADLATLEEIADLFPYFSLPLLDLMAHAETRMVDLLRQMECKGEEREIKLGTHLSYLGYRLSNLGRHEEALAAAEEAVAIYRNLSAARPEVFRPDLARSLNSLGNRLSVLGRLGEALAAAGEAVAIHRDLSVAHPEAFLPDLAMTLDILGFSLGDLGRHDEALAAAGEAVAIHRNLSVAHPEVYRPNLARSLNNLGVRLSSFGRYDEALVAAEEAVAICRVLVAARPEAFLPELARFLNNFGNNLSYLARYDEALVAAEEAVAIYRDLAAARPEAFLPDLGRFLHSLGNRLNDLGRHEEALAAIEEAVAIDRDLANAHPQIFLPLQAGELNYLADSLVGLGRWKEAEAVTEELIKIYSDPVASHQESVQSVLTRLQNNLRRIRDNDNTMTGEYISNIKIRNLKCLRQFSWKLEAGEEAPGWHVLLGDNGSGKSTFLQACAMGMLPVADVHAADVNLDGWPSEQEEMAEIWIHCDSGRKLYTTIHRARENPIERKWSSSFVAFGAAYGPYRRFRGGTDKAAGILNSSRPLARYLSVFGEDAAMVHVQSWLRDLHHAMLEGKSAEKKMLADVTTFLNQEGLLPQEVQLVSVSSDQVVFEDPAGTRVDINSLSDGYRSILSMMLELIRQMGLFYRDQTIFSPNGHQVIMPGVVLLDEIDAHLHPRWQRVIGPWLTRCFPKVQFLITTHSVLVCQGAIKGSVWLLPDPANPDDSGQRLTGSALDQLLYGNLLEAYHSNAFGPGIDRSDEARKKLEYFAHLNVKSVAGMLQPHEEREHRTLQRIFGASSDAWGKP
ncbi:MAG: tetratricopeptide repeat protein [Magnetococcales bacterium]|nr:tetratricopeptide repeat protein [Magnetococcales bacterium]